MTDGNAAPARAAAVNDRRRAEALRELAGRADGLGLNSLTDDEMLNLLAEHRWAIARLARGKLNVALRSTLNAAVLTAHGVLHRRTRRHQTPAGDALRLAGSSIALSAAVFLGSGLLAAAAVLADPLLAFSLVPRQFLAQIDTQAWGDRGGVGADVGMTLFYWANNLRASFLALGLGVLGGIPALLVVAFNGALIGAVAGVSLNRGVLHRLLGWIGPHGVPELGALVLCGAIGVLLGRAWIVPGWRTRRSALADMGRRLTPLVVIAAIMVICAAPLEGFVAPRELPSWVDGGIALTWAMLLTGMAFVAVRRSRAADDLLDEIGAGTG